MTCLSLTQVFLTGTRDIWKGVRCALGGGYQHIHQGGSWKVIVIGNNISHSRPLGLLLAPGSRGRRGQARGRPGRRPGASWSSTSRWMISCSQNVYYDENALWRTEDAVLLTPFVQDHVKRTMEKGLYTLEDGELIPEPTLSDKGKVGEHNQLPRHTAFHFRLTSWQPRRGWSCPAASVEPSLARNPILTCICSCTKGRVAGSRKELKRRKLEHYLIFHIHCITHRGINWTLLHLML